MSDIKTQLLEIRELLQTGLITQGEHDELREKILASIALELDKKTTMTNGTVSQTIVPMAGEMEDFEEEPMFLVPDLRDEEEGRWSSKTRPPIPNSEFPNLNYSEPVSGRAQGDLAEFADADDATSPFIRKVGDEFEFGDTVQPVNVTSSTSKYSSGATKSSNPMLLVTEGLCNVKEIQLQPGLMTIGRGRKCDVMIMNDPKASRQHCTINFISDQYMIEDANSIHGTWINRSKIESAVPLQNGDEIRVGETVFIYRGS